MTEPSHVTVRLLVCGSASEVTRALCASLDELGLAAGTLDTAGPVLLLDTSGADLTDVVRAASSGGDRLLAVDCSGASGSVAGWNLLTAGAGDAIRCEDPVDCARSIAGRFRRWLEIDRLTDSPAVRDLVVGHSPAWRRAIRDIVEMAAFTSAPVLIMGESGTGKELVARLIHALDRRVNKGELVLLDCSTIVPELSGSEFFGHEKGSYTGANQVREGAFAIADRGSLFLDEIGELPPALQAQLLRAVQERTYKRLGSNLWKQTDFRLISATNRDLMAEVEGGGFRRDLY
jgi:DNA-binding NtrC family response regulator